MKILLIDIQRERALKLQEILAENHRHTVVHADHTNGLAGGFFNNRDWNETNRQACEAYLQGVHPDLVLLHVGERQTNCKECLAQVYQNCIVVCFTGAPIPHEVEEDCLENDKHCYFPGAFAVELPTLEDWRRSAEVSALMIFIDAVEQYLQEDKATPANAMETLAKAKNAFQHFDQYLEDTLKYLTEKLWKLLLQEPPPSEEQFKSLAEERDENFRFVKEQP